MARAEPGTAAPEFFIVVGDNPKLDFGAARYPDLQGFAAFGQVIEGMDVVRTIVAAPTSRTTGAAYMQGQALNEPVAFTVIRR